MRVASTAITIIFWSMTSVLFAAVMAHCTLPDDTFPAAALHPFAGYLWVLCIPTLALAFASAHRARMTVSILVMASAAWLVFPGHIDHSMQGPGALRIVTANVLMVHPDPVRLVEDLVAEDPDIIMLQEVNPRWASVLERSDALAGWPYRVIAPEEGSFGVAILSKRPGDFAIEDLAGVMTARFDTMVGEHPVRLYDVHTLPPRDPTYTTHWAAQMQQLAVLAQHSDVPIILAGDFNATRHHPSYQRLVQAGLRDAHAVTGQASTPTWPNGLFPVPPLQLDHVLVSDGVNVHSVHHGPANGSDHVPVVVDLSVGTPTETTVPPASLSSAPMTPHRPGNSSPLESLTASHPPVSRPSLVW